jgi:hypothetical protein
LLGLLRLFFFKVFFFPSARGEFDFDFDFKFEVDAGLDVPAEGAPRSRK